jgi:hypothetical protein
MHYPFFPLPARLRLSHIRRRIRRHIPQQARTARESCSAKDFSPRERSALFHDNAKRVYRL